MSDIANSTSKIQVEGARTRSPVSESLVQAIGGAVNYLLGNVIKEVNVVTITSTQFYNKPANLLYAKITCIGGGGGSGSASSATGGKFGPGTPATSGGGGGGGYSMELIAAASMAGSELVTIGAGGTAGAGSWSNAGNGSTGGTSSFGAFLSAAGGAGSAGADFVDTSGGAGGNGSGGDLNVRGQGGQGRSGGSSLFGFAPAFSPSMANGVAGQAYGGGAAGAYADASGNNFRTGAAGGNGVVIIEEFLR